MGGRHDASCSAPRQMENKSGGLFPASKSSTCLQLSRSRRTKPKRSAARHRGHVYQTCKNYVGYSLQIGGLVLEGHGHVHARQQCGNTIECSGTHAAGRPCCETGVIASGPRNEKPRPNGPFCLLETHLRCTRAPRACIPYPVSRIPTLGLLGQSRVSRGWKHRHVLFGRGKEHSTRRWSVARHSAWWRRTGMALLLDHRHHVLVTVPKLANSLLKHWVNRGP